MGIHAGEAAVLDEEDPVHLLDGGDAVGDENGGSAGSRLAKIAQNCPLGFDAISFVIRALHSMASPVSSFMYPKTFGFCFAK